MGCMGLLVASCSFSSVPTHSESKEVTSSSSQSSISEASSSESLASSIAPGTSVDSFAESQPVSKTKMRYTFKDYGSHNIAKSDFCPNQGNPKLLVIPVWFTDSSDFINMSHREDVRQDIESCYFGENEEVGWRSVRTYYSELSQNRCNLEGVVSDWFECGDSFTSAGKFSSDVARLNYMDRLVDRAVEWYFTQPNAEERIDFDLDENGFLDGVMLIYGAPDYSALANNPNYRYTARNFDNLWAYCTWLTENEADIDTPNTNVIFWASYDFMYGRERIYERTGSSIYYGGDTDSCNLDTHTFIHEMGHVFGASDYYDYSGGYCPAGGFSMQDNNVGSHDPFTALACGWVDPYIPKTSCDITLRPFQSQGHDVILLSPFWDSINSPFDEYLLLELYTPTGLNEFDSDNPYKLYYPSGTKECGIRLWHVDARLVKPKRVTLTGQVFWDTTPLNDPTIDNVYHMITNTYYSASAEGYCSVLGSSYADYNMLQLIKNSTTSTHKNRYGNYFGSSDLFKDGDVFDMKTFGKQFVNVGELNNQDLLGWAFEVSITGTGENTLAKISLARS